MAKRPRFTKAIGCGRNDYIDSVIIGPRTLAQAEDALEVDFDDELEQAIDALVPRGTHAGREAPDQEVFPVVGRRAKGE